MELNGKKLHVSQLPMLSPFNLVGYSAIYEES